MNKQRYRLGSQCIIWDLRQDFLTWSSTNSPIAGVYLSKRDCYDEISGVIYRVYVEKVLVERGATPAPTDQRCVNKEHSDLGPIAVQPENVFARLEHSRPSLAEYDITL